MKKTIKILILVLLSHFSYGQITTTKVAKKKEEISTKRYDSLQNFLGKDVYKYIGQELYLKGKSESLREYGYENFYKGYNKNEKIYKCCESYNSKYDELAGKYFNVLAVYKHPKAEESESLYGTKYYLELKEKESGDKVYFKYDTKYKYSFPFIVTGFFIKQKVLNTNKEFVIRGKNWVSKTRPMTDINTGQPVSFESGSKWKGVDLTIEEEYFTLSIILQNEKGEKIPISLDNTNNTNFVFVAEEADKYKKSFGDKNWSKILNGKVLVGFSEEMVLLSWGKPKKINRTSYRDQWVYDGQYLYFENGKLESFN